MEKQDRVNNLLTEFGLDVHPADIAEAIRRSRQGSEARRDEGRGIMSDICTSSDLYERGSRGKYHDGR